ncbi:MAG: hypothetical protein Q4E35_09120 [Eubacteriales bacterium]|nr:hypothetical protein [Eubacteriales bacterium]
MKKLVCILLTLVMVMSLSITAFAVDGNKEVESLTENNTQDITITNTISTGEGSATSAPKYYVGIEWDVYVQGGITIDRSAEYEWNPVSLTYELSGEPTYDLNSESDGTTNVHITVTNYSNADIGYMITWETDAQCEQYNGFVESIADENGVCQANKKIGRADGEYNEKRAVDEEYTIYPDAEGFDGYEGEAQYDDYFGVVTFHPISNLDQLYNMNSITLGKYTVTIGNPPPTGEN